MPTRLRSTLLLLLAAVTALALAACGGDDNAVGEEASASTDVNQLLKETFTGNKKVDSGRLNLTVAVDAPGAQGAQAGPINVKLAGPFQSRGAGKLPSLKMDLAFTGSGQNIKAGVTSTGDKGFVNFNNQDYAVSDQVFRQFQAGYEQAQKQAQQQNRQQQQSLTTLGIDPRKWLTNAKNAGEAKVGDADAIRITGGVDVPKLLDDVNVALDKASQLGLQDAGQVPEKLTDEQRRQITEAVKGLKVELFTGKEDKVLRRMLVDLDLQSAAGEANPAQSAKVKLDFSLTELNQDQEIAAPARTKPFDELLGQLGGLGGGLGGLGGAGGGAGGGTGGSGGTGRADQEDLQKYTDCITQAGSDTAKAQECAKLLAP